MKAPLFSIVTTTYNRTELLEECLNSLYSQAFTDYEHIIVDGNSTDGTFELVQSVIKSHPDKDIRVFKREPKGVYDAINFGIQKATGTYINLLNSDDYYANNEVLGEIAKIIAKNSFPMWVQGIRVQKFPSGRIKRSHEPFGHQQAFLKKEIHDRFGLYSTNYKCSADTEFYLKIAETIKPVKTDLDTVIQNNHSKSLTMNGLTGDVKMDP